MSIVKISFTLLLLTLSSCAVVQQNEITQQSKASDPCLETRGAIDIGSGTSKLVVAVVNKCDFTIDHILFEAHRAISFKEALQRNPENRFGLDITKRAISTLNELKHIARAQGAKEIRAVATSAFRTAKNAKETKIEIEKKTNLKIKIITQSDEAQFAYGAAVSLAKSMKLLNGSPIAVWDIGGGSMQIVTSNQGKKIIYLGKLASVSFKDKILQELYSKSAKGPNPIGKDRAINAMTISRNYANQHAKPILSSLKKYQVFGVGGVHYYSVRQQVNSKSISYDQGVLLKALLERALLTDKKIGGEYASTDVTNLALVLGHMQSLLIDKVIPLKINMSHGVLINENLW